MSEPTRITFPADLPERPSRAAQVRARALAARIRTIAARAAEPPAAGFVRRTVSLATVDDGDGKRDGQFIYEGLLSAEELNLIACALAAYGRAL